MCGIAGYSQGLSSSALSKFNTLQAHRGPDDAGIWFDNVYKIGLAHRRLSILDISSLGHQPMLNSDESVVLIFNGEIYNFRELRSEMELEGYQFRGHSDTEVLLSLYLHFGVSLLPKLNGIFAFAIWDKRSQELLLARDPLGVKPLYYNQSKQGFAFASEIKTLLPLLDSPLELDAISLHRYLSFLWCPGDGTPVKNVRKLPPGEAIVVREGRIAQKWQWYQLPAFRNQQADMDEATAIRGTEEALRKAVHRQLVADVPLGSFLSGGLDSSAIVAIAREQVPDIRCFTIESHGNTMEGYVDDLPYARRVAQHLGVPLDVVTIDSVRMAGDIEMMVHQLDEPLADPASLNVLYISRLARDQGVKVLLSGAGGDDLFTGYRRHFALSLERFLSWLPISIRDKLDRTAAGLDQRTPLYRRLAKLLSGAGLDGDARLANYFVWSRESHLMGLYTPEFRRAVGTESAVQTMLDFLRLLPASTPRMERLLALEQRFFLTDHNLTYTDKMSMAAGVEVRVPFLDLDLVDFAGRIPAKFKQRGREGKWVLKKAMEHYLPHDIIHRPKSGFGAPLRHWMRHELRELLGDLLSEESIHRRGLFDPIAVQQLINQNYTGKIDASYTLLSLLCIEIWCRQFLNQKISMGT